MKQAVRERFGAFAKDVAAGLRLRHDHGSQYVSHDFQAEIRFLGIARSPAFVREPEGNGCAERFIRTLKENLLWVRPFATVEELRLALIAFKRTYNQAWIIERHGYKTPAQVRADQSASTHGRVSADRCLTTVDRYTGSDCRCALQSVATRPRLPLGQAVSSGSRTAPGDCLRIHQPTQTLCDFAYQTPVPYGCNPTETGPAGDRCRGERAPRTPASLQSQRNVSRRMLRSRARAPMFASSYS